MCATALMVASKFDEIDYNLVKVRELLACFPMQSANDFVVAEKKLLLFFDWDLKLSTPFHFIQNYQTSGVALKGEDRARLFEEVSRVYEQFTKDESTYLQIRSSTKPSLIAAAILREARSR
jgi:hypothetical protein